MAYYSPHLKKWGDTYPMPPTKLSPCLQDWRCVKYTKLVSLRNNCNAFTCVRHCCGLELLEDRYVQVWIVAEGWERSQAGRLLRSWPQSYSVFYHCPEEKTPWHLYHSWIQRWNRLSKSLNCFANNADDECLLQPTRNWFLHTLDQDRLCDPALSTGRNDTEKTEFDEMINEFASIKARKVLLQVACCVI